MMKQLYIFALAQIVSIAPALASVSSASLAASDKQELSVLETKFFTHEDVNRTLDERLDKIESLVFGAKMQGSFHERLTRIADTCSREQAPAYKPEPPRLSQPAKPAALAHQPARVQTFPALTSYEIDEDQPDARPTVYFHHAAAVRQTVTVVDRIEWLEMSLFGRKDCAGKIQKRVAKLENCVYGLKASQVTEPSITARVNKLWYAVNAS